MKNNWRNIHEFHDEEKKYRCGCLLTHRYYEICDRFKFIEATDHWATEYPGQYVPDAMNHIFPKDKDIRPFFDHFYSFKTASGEVYWVVCPYDCGWDILDIERAFKENGFDCDIVNGFYATYTIIMKPANVIEALSKK